MVPVTLVLGSAAEVLSTYAAEVASTHRAAKVTSAHSAKMSTAQPTAVASTASTAVASTAATTGKRIGRNAGASHRYGGNDDRDSVQHKFLHGSFLSS
jgi:hypothetical protein